MGNIVVIAGLMVWGGTVAWSWLWGYRPSRGTVAGKGAWLFSLTLGGRAAVLLLFSAAGAYVIGTLWIALPISPSGGLEQFLEVLGLILFMSGVGLYVWGRLALGSLFAVSTSTAVQLHANHHLVQSGPFAFVRHPMYLGMITALIGLVMTYRTWAPVVLALIFAVALPLRARREERALAHTFGREWHAYARRVPGWVPRRMTRAEPRT